VPEIGPLEEICPSAGFAANVGDESRPAAGLPWDHDLVEVADDDVAMS